MKIFSLIFGELSSGKMLLRLAIAVFLGALISQVFYIEPLAKIAPETFLISKALGSLFIWALTFFIHLLVASSVWLAVSKNSNSVGIAVSAIILFAITTTFALCYGALAGWLFEPGIGITFEAAKDVQVNPTIVSMTSFVSAPFNSLRAEVNLLHVIAYMVAASFISVPFLPLFARYVDIAMQILQRFTVTWMKKILVLLPAAVFFMTFAIIGQNGLMVMFEKAGRIILSDVFALTLHMLTLIMILMILFRKSVIKYVQAMFPAYITALVHAHPWRQCRLQLNVLKKQVVIQNFPFCFPIWRHS